MTLRCNAEWWLGLVVVDVARCFSSFFSSEGGTFSDELASVAFGGGASIRIQYGGSAFPRCFCHSGSHSTAKLRMPSASSAVVTLSTTSGPRGLLNNFVPAGVHSPECRSSANPAGYGTAPRSRRKATSGSNSISA